MNIDERLAALRQHFEIFTIRGHTLQASGSIRDGFILRDTSSVALTRGGRPDVSETPPGDDVPPPVEPVTYDISGSVSAPDYNCDGTVLVGPFTYTNPFEGSALYAIEADVDDELVVDGVIIGAGDFPFSEAGGHCATSGPSGGPANGAHHATHSGTVGLGGTVSVAAGNNYAGTCSIEGTITFTAL